MVGWLLYPSPEEQIELERRVRARIIAEEYVDPDFIAAKGWVAVAVESTSAHFHSENVDQFCTACGNLNIRKVVAVQLDENPYAPRVVEFKVRTSDLFEVRKIFSGTKTAFTTRSEDFLTLNTLDDYSIYAGPKEFVEIFLGKSLSEAARWFYEYSAPCELWSEDGQRFLRAMLEKYFDISPDGKEIRSKFG